MFSQTVYIYLITVIEHFSCVIEIQPMNTFKRTGKSVLGYRFIKCYKQKIYRFL